VFLALALLSWAATADAATSARLARIDLRPGIGSADPVLTTVVSLSPASEPAELVARCGSLSGEAELECLLAGLDDPAYLEPGAPPPTTRARLTVEAPKPEAGAGSAELVSAGRWDASAGEPGVGTAWIIVLDASEAMKPRFGEAKRIARAFLESLGPHDLAQVLAIDDAAVAAKSPWLANKGLGANFVDGLRGTLPRAAGTQPLDAVLREAATGALRELGLEAGQGRIAVPMHQALVLLASGADVRAVPDAGRALGEALRRGIADVAHPIGRAPLPVVSVWLPPPKIEREARQLGRDFLASLVDSADGGVIVGVPSAATSGRPERIVRAVRRRFDQMYVMRWRVPCLPEGGATFALSFEGATPPVLGDRRTNVAFGAQAARWPLAVDAQATLAEAGARPARPGGRLVVRGRFCWGEARERAELVLLAPDQRPPAAAPPKDEALAALLGSAQRVRAVEVGREHAVFELPDDARFVHDEPLAGAAGRARVILRDTGLGRWSGATEASLLTLPAARRSLAVWVLAVAGGALALTATAVAVWRRRARQERLARPTPVPSRITPSPAVALAQPTPLSAPLVLPRVAPARSAAPTDEPALAADREPDPPPSAPPGPVLGPTEAAASEPAPRPSGALLEGALGRYRVAEGAEARVGRDPGGCAVCLSEPGVGLVHATVRVEAGRLLVRDEGTPEGTFVGGVRAAALVWTPVGDGAALAFGPVVFTVRLEYK
jgi:hypothetical protein